MLRKVANGKVTVVEYSTSVKGFLKSKYQIVPTESISWSQNNKQSVEKLQKLQNL